MNIARPMTFWIVMLAAVLAVIVLLREVRLPFVAGMMLAYLLDPLAFALFAFVGLLIAAPLAAAIGVFARLAFKLYYASPRYGGSSTASGTRTGSGSGIVSST